MAFSFKQRIAQPVIDQLKQGVTPEKLALTIALGAVLGIFPIIGATTLLCLIAGLACKLNQPAIQAVNYVIYPLQILLLPAFVRAGEFLFRAEPITFNVLQLKDEFLKSPAQFMKDFGMAGLHGITAWTLAAPLGALLLYRIFLPVLRRISLELRSRRTP